MKMERNGPLRGLKVVEMAGVGPTPFCAMMLADMGAEVLTVDRLSPSGLGIKKEAKYNPTTRSRQSMTVDLKSPDGVATVARLVSQADALIEGFRPGVMERLGLGPDICLRSNPKLVYGRMTGWGQTGPIAHTVGHDLNYLALTGTLAMLGRRDGPPTIPLNLLGDYAGGGAYLAIGVLSAMIESRISGQGQVVDAAMVDGILSLMTHQLGFIESGRWLLRRESNFIDGGSPWYNVYETKDGLYVAVAPIEARFYRELLLALDIDPDTVPDQLDQSSWPGLKQRFADIFRTRTRDEWCVVMEGKETCFSPVLDIEEAKRHPQFVARGSFVNVDGVIHSAPAPRYSRTGSEISSPPPEPGADTTQALLAWGFGDREIEALRDAGTIG